MKNIGSRLEVMKGKARKTSGGLTKKNLKYDKNGKIISKKISNMMKLRNKMYRGGTPNKVNNNNKNVNNNKTNNIYIIYLLLFLLVCLLFVKKSFKAL